MSNQALNSDSELFWSDQTGVSKNWGVCRYTGIPKYAGKFFPENDDGLLDLGIFPIEIQSTPNIISYGWSMQCMYIYISIIHRHYIIIYILINCGSSTSM